MRAAGAARQVLTRGTPPRMEGCRPASRGLSLTLMTCREVYDGPGCRSPPSPARLTRRSAARMGAMTFHADEYKAAAGRYRAGMPYRRVGRSGLDLPAVSLGLWHNFGDDVPLERQQATLRRAFDRGVTHFDLANNYGPPYGSAERNFGADLRPRLPALPRRAGHQLQGRLRHVAGPVRAGRRLAQVPHRVVRPVAAADGPGLRRHLLQPPVRRDDAARGDAGRAGLARAAGQGALRRHLVVLGGTRTREAVEILRAMGTPLLIHQPSYSMLNRWIEEDLLDASATPGSG